MLDVIVRLNEHEVLIVYTNRRSISVYSQYGWEHAAEHAVELVCPTWHEVPSDFIINSNEPGLENVCIISTAA